MGYPAYDVARARPEILRELRRDRKMTVHDRIEINPKIMLGKPVIRGTRIPVELIVRKMAEGADEKALLQAYPNLTPQDVHAALRYAADSLAHEEVVVSTAG
jgi:uncharacterized protein (DUF433 family)